MNGIDKDEVVQIHLDDIIPNRFQPREVFDERALKELAVSIKEHGVIQPIIVRNVNGKYEIIAGERRYKASALAGLTKIPAIIRDLDDKESSKVALLENLQRKNLNAIEEARTYQKILEIDEMTQDELAKTMGKSQSAVANKIRLLTLPDEIQEALLKEEISERHARALLNVPDIEKQKELLNKVKEEKISVRKLEEEINTLYPKNKKNEEESNIQESQPSANEFLNNNPLTPTGIEIAPEEEDDYGKVVIAPPDEEKNDKFINYNDISNSNNNIENKTEEMTIKQPENQASLDSLLNLGQPTMTPADKIEDNIIKDSTTESEEYFNNVEKNELEAPNIDIFATQPTPSLEQGPVPNQNGNTSSIEVAKEQIKNTVETLKNNGVMINCDEMDFPETYQFIIKISKEKVE